jgi:hypothetical protein
MEKFHRFKPNCTLPDDVPVGFVNAPNIRTTMQIIWSCFSVILLCTWSILRPNVPPELKPKPKAKRQKIYKMLFLLSRKIYWAGIMLIAPEFLTTFTTKKMFGTRENVAILKALAGLPQTILADMGGIIIDFSNIEDRDIDNEKSGLETLRGEDISTSNHEAQSPSQEALGSSQEMIRSPREIESQPLQQRYKDNFIIKFEQRQSRWLGGCEIP